MLKQAIFNRIHHSNLVYNTCWEDPRCDRALLQLDHNSKVVMITSAGCNALDYLLDHPASVDCVDLNPRQNALLELKKSVFQHGDHHDLFQFFGQGVHRQARPIFEDALRHGLDQPHARYWRKHLGYFSGKGLRRSFYYYGSSGLVAYIVKNLIGTSKETARLVYRLLDCADPEMQKMLYYRLEARLFNPFFVRFLDGHLTQSLLGVPESQQQMARAQFKDGMAGYVRACFRHVFTELPLRDNYFWKLYFFGHYTPDCCPNYLLPEHFDTLKTNSAALKTHTTSISEFLKNNPGQYTHFVLLDHQDWLAANDQKALREEWELILANSAKNAKYLLRSAGPDLRFIPEAIVNQIEFDTEAAAAQHRLDRVGTYASVHLGQFRA